jgi:hypothetical protein
MISDSAIREAAASEGRDGLAEGLMLVQASNLKMIRLQLAMERRDRRAAIEAVDELVALDRSLEEVLAGQGPNAIGRALGEDRAALNREKLILAAGVVLERPPWLEPVEALECDDAAEGPLPDYARMDEPDEAEPPKRNRWLLVGIAVLLSAVAGGAYWLAMFASAGWLRDASNRLLGG